MESGKTISWDSGTAAPVRHRVRSNRPGSGIVLKAVQNVDTKSFGDDGEALDVGARIGSTISDKACGSSLRIKMRETKIQT